MITLRDDGYVQIKIADHLAGKVELCPRCKGSGRLGNSASIMGWTITQYYHCEVCNGRGIVDTFIPMKVKS